MLYASCKYLHDKEGCKKIISDALYNLHFIYEKPDDKVSAFIYSMNVITNHMSIVYVNCGPFCSTFISKVYAVHIQKIHIQPRYGLQIGGLALAAAVV